MLAQKDDLMAAINSALDLIQHSTTFADPQAFVQRARALQTKTAPRADGSATPQASGRER